MEPNLPDLAQRPVDRSLLHAIGKHVHWNEQLVRDVFSESGIYPGRRKWLSWSTRFFAGVGVAFLLAGILFFFAWNWADMSRMLKFGIIGGGIVVFTVAALVLRKKHEFAFQLGLTIVSALTGVLFAVSGQEYQTGANSFELFRNWAIAILLLVAVSNFSPLWLLYTVLLNIVVFTWNLQFENRHEEMLFTELFIVNALPLIAWEICSGFGAAFARGRWFPRTVGLAAFVFLTVRLMITGHDFADMKRDELVCCIIAVPAFAIAIGYLGFYRKSVFFLALTGFCLVMILSGYLDLLLPPLKPIDADHALENLNGLGDRLNRMYLVMMMRGVFIISLTSLIGVQLVKLNKKWRHDEQS